MATPPKPSPRRALLPTQEIEQVRILREGSGYAAYRFSRDIPGADIQALQEVVLTRGSGEDAHRFARNIPGAAVEALQEVVLARGTGPDAYWFALEIPGANVQILQEVVLTRGTGSDAYWFASEVPGANIQALQEVVITRGDAYDAYRFALVPGADILACACRVVFLDPQDERGSLRRLQEMRPAVLTPEVLAELSLGVTL